MKKYKHVAFNEGCFSPDEVAGERIPWIDMEYAPEYCVARDGQVFDTAHVVSVDEFCEKLKEKSRQDGFTHISFDDGAYIFPSRVEELVYKSMEVEELFSLRCSQYVKHLCSDDMLKDLTMMLAERRPIEESIQWLEGKLSEHGLLDE